MNALDTITDSDKQLKLRRYALLAGDRRTDRKIIETYDTKPELRTELDNSGYCGNWLVIDFWERKFETGSTIKSDLWAFSSGSF